MDNKIKFLFKNTPVEGNALEQLKQTASLPGVIKAVGLPDLHAGKGCPIGAAILTQGLLYPHLVGSDIGCGMLFSMLDIKAHKAKRDKIVKRLGSLEGGYEGDLSAVENKLGIKLDRFTSALGTIGGGNHHCEIQLIEDVVNPEIFNSLNLDHKNLFVLIHSGSRGLGEYILRQHTDKFKAESLTEQTSDFNNYLKNHDYAVKWAEANRLLIQAKVCDRLGVEATKVLDITHNYVQRYPEGYLHRKGAAPSDQGLIVIPGSRGHFSYLVKPLAGESLHSLAHGAGRKWKRSDSKDRLSDRYRPDDLIITDLKSQVICEDKDLLYEEAPENYKNITKVIEDLVELKLIKVVAILRPLVTYKTKRQECCDKD